MKLINIEPYAGLDPWAQRDKTGRPIIQGLFDNMKKKGCCFE